MAVVEAQTDQGRVANAFLIVIEVVLVVAMNRVIVRRVKPIKVAAFIDFEHKVFGPVFTQFLQIFLHSL